MKKLISVALVGCMAVSLAACGGASSSTASSTASSAAGETLTGQGQGFGGVITATVTMEGDAITGVTFDGPDETPEIGGAAFETLAEQIVAANGVEIDGVSVTFRGNDGRFYLATWSEENFSFSLSCTMGLTQIEWEPLVSQAIEPET